MAEDDNVLEPRTAPEQPKKQKNFKAGLKEWVRKQVVTLKRAPQRIALFVLAITTVYFLLALFNISQAIIRRNLLPIGFCVFII